MTPQPHSRSHNRKPLFRRAAAIAACLALGALAPASQAHHSTAMFQWGDEVRLSNMVIDRWEWTNPHTFIYAHDASGNRWALEGMSPNHLSRAGWNRRSLSVGSRVDLTYYPLRDGRRGGFNVAVIFPDGHRLNQLDMR